jgi:type I restriction enzyme, R subunit
MYVDKPLSGIKAVQTLSRLNRAHPKKHDVFVLDFMNDTDTIEQAFADYYRTTILSRGDRPEQAARPEGRWTATRSTRRADRRRWWRCTWAGADRDKLDPILDACVAVYKDELDEDGRWTSRARPRRSLRTYGFLARSCPTPTQEWEKLSIFLNFLCPSCPPRRGGPVQGHPRSHRHGQLPRREAGGDEDPAPRCGRRDRAGADRRRRAQARAGAGPALEHPQAFNDQFGNIPWTDADRVHKLITEDIPSRVAADTAYQNAKKNSDKQNARIEHDKALRA